MTVYAAVDAENTLLHSKLIITDGERMSIGSANGVAPVTQDRRTPLG
ncbi:hypothetical protein [Burkholderia pseudomallei]